MTHHCYFFLSVDSFRNYAILVAILATILAAILDFYTHNYVQSYILCQKLNPCHQKHMSRHQYHLCKSFRSRAMNILSILVFLTAILEAILNFNHRETPKPETNNSSGCGMLILVEKDTSSVLVSYMAPEILPFLFSKMAAGGHLGFSALAKLAPIFERYMGAHFFLK